MKNNEENKDHGFQTTIDYRHIEALTCDILQSMRYIEEYGHVGFYDCTEEENKRLGDEIQTCIEKAQKLCDDYTDRIKENYGG